MTDGQITAQLRARRWQRGLPGVYVTYTGPLTPLAHVWVALLYCGDGATAIHGTAEWLARNPRGPSGAGACDGAGRVVEFAGSPGSSCSMSSAESRRATAPGRAAAPDARRGDGARPRSTRRPDQRVR